MKSATRPEAIILTMPFAFFREYTLERFEREMEAMKTNSLVWYRAVKNLPVYKTLYCYIVYYNKIQWRTNILEFEKNVTRTFSRPVGGERTFADCNMIALCGPTIKAPTDYEMKGFQGFRYSQIIF
jgi:hypothetical protein